MIVYRSRVVAEASNFLVRLIFTYINIFTVVNTYDNLNALR